MKSEATTAQNRLLVYCRGEASVRWKRQADDLLSGRFAGVFFGNTPRIILKKRVASFLRKF
jgi:hypothetical protein